MSPWVGSVTVERLRTRLLLVTQMRRVSSNRSLFSTLQVKGSSGSARQRRSASVPPGQGVFVIHTQPKIQFVAPSQIRAPLPPHLYLQTQ